jgi:ABC-type multidrug transport system ATPase subunit
VTAVTAASALVARGLAKRYGHACALSPTDLTVEPGERVAVFGHNGAGKTTLIRLLATAIRPSEGQVWVRGRAASDAPADVRRELGLVSHTTYLYPDLTATENLHFYARMFGLDRIEERIDRSVRRVGLHAVRDRRVRTFSRGMQQRLSIARATLHEPAVLLLDEPESGLDAEAGARLPELLGLEGEARFAEPPAVVWATHDHALGRRLCGRAIRLERGSVVEAVTCS